VIDYKGILKALSMIDRVKVNKDRQERFWALAEVHGMEHVALASGLNISTVKTYLGSRKNIPTIGLEPLLQAESILK